MLPILRRTVPAVLAVAFAAAPVLGQSGYRQGYVTKGSQKFEGKILDRGDRIIVDRGNGITLEFDPSEVKVTYTDGGADAGAPGTNKTKWVEIVKSDGAILRGEVMENKDGLITIRPRNREGKPLDPVSIKLSEVARLVDVPAPDAARADAELDRYPDWDGRFLLEKPSPEWRIARSSSPDVRASLSLVGKDASIAISVKPVGALAAGHPWLEPTRENARKVQPLVDPEIKAELDRPSGINCDLGELFGAPVYELRFEGNLPSDPIPRQFLELRFHRDGSLYVLRGSAPKASWKDLEAKLREGFTAFSFLPAQSGDQEGWNDLVKGYGIDRPSPKWTVEARPFDEREPVLLKNEDGRALIHVWTAEANGRSTGQYLDEFLKTLEQRTGYEKRTRAPDERTGSPVETYRVEYYEKGAAKKRDFHGVVALVDRTIVHVEGVAPIADVDARNLQEEVQLALKHLRIFDARASKRRLSEGAKAAEELAKGADALKKKQYPDAITFLSEAIKLYKDYARAYFLRAQVYVEQKQWKLYREDLGEAIRLDPRIEEANLALALYVQEATQRARDKQWVDASRAWRDALKCDPKNDRNRKEIVRFYTEWWNDLKRPVQSSKKDEVPNAAKEAIEEVERNRWPDPEFNTLFANFLVEAGEFVLRADPKNHSRAKAYASRAQSFDKDSQRAKTLAKQCDDEKKRLDQQSKKGK